MQILEKLFNIRYFTIIYTIILQLLLICYIYNTQKLLRTIYDFVQLYCINFNERIIFGEIAKYITVCITRQLKNAIGIWNLT